MPSSATFLSNRFACVVSLIGVAWVVALAHTSFAQRPTDCPQRFFASEPRHRQRMSLPPLKGAVDLSFAHRLYADGRYEQAIDVANQAAHTESVRSMRVAALGVAARSHEMLGEWEEAAKLKRLIVAEEKELRYRDFCGNAIAAKRYTRKLLDGYDAEKGGDVRTAVQHYFSTLGLESLAGVNIDYFAAERRIAELYCVTGKKDVLLGILDELDVQQKAKYPKLYLDPKYPTLLPTFLVRRCMYLHELERKKNWTTLIAVMNEPDPVRDTFHFTENRSGYFDSWERHEALRLLAKNAMHTEKLLINEVNRVKNKTFLFYALGACETRSAVDVLRRYASPLDEAPLEVKRHAIPAMQALSFAGSSGLHELQKIEQDRTDGLSVAAARIRRTVDFSDNVYFLVAEQIQATSQFPGPFPHTVAFPFPAKIDGEKLPRTLAEIGPLKFK